ncbi:MAG: DUF998 domain-containing protein [Promethearchaeota archaeon]
MTSKWSLLSISAIIGSVAYCVLTIVSISFYPAQFSPLDDYLSVLGNSSLNPDGAIFYNLGVFLAGLFLFPFYVGMYKTYSRLEHGKLLAAAVAFGMFNAFSVMMSGIFSEDLYEIHYFWSLMIFASWIPVLYMVNSAVMKHHGFIRWVSYYGLFLATFDTLFVTYVLFFGTDTGSILEWVTIFSFLTWAVLHAFAVLRNKKPSS